MQHSSRSILLALDTHYEVDIHDTKKQTNERMETGSGMRGLECEKMYIPADEMGRTSSKRGQSLRDAPGNEFHDLRCAIWQVR